MKWIRTLDTCNELEVLLNAFVCFQPESVEIETNLLLNNSYYLCERERIISLFIGTLFLELELSIRMALKVK